MANQNLHLLNLTAKDSGRAVAGLTMLLGRWGCFLNSMVVSQCNENGESAVTALIESTSQQANRILLQLEKLEPVLKASLLSNVPLSGFESVQLKICSNGVSHGELCKFCNRHGASVSGRTEDYIKLEITAEPHSIAMLVNEAFAYNLLEAKVLNVSYIMPNAEKLLLVK